MSKFGLDTGDPMAPKHGGMRSCGEHLVGFLFVFAGPRRYVTVTQCTLYQTRYALDALIIGIWRKTEPLEKGGKVQDSDEIDKMEIRSRQHFVPGSLS